MLKHENYFNSLQKMEQTNYKDLLFLVGLGGRKFHKPVTLDPCKMSQNLTFTFVMDGNKRVPKEEVEFKHFLRKKMIEHKVKVVDWNEATENYRIRVVFPLLVSLVILAVLFTLDCLLCCCTCKKRMVPRRWGKLAFNVPVPFMRILKKEIDGVIANKRSVTRLVAFLRGLNEVIYVIVKFLCRPLVYVGVMKWRFRKIFALSNFLVVKSYPAHVLRDYRNQQIVCIDKIPSNWENLSYMKKIEFGINKLTYNLCTIMFCFNRNEENGIEKVGTLNINLSDHVVDKGRIKDSILNSFLPKIYSKVSAPRLLVSRRFSLNKENQTSFQIIKTMGKELKDLLPKGKNFYNFLKSPSRSDIVSNIFLGRTGVSYGFVGFAEPPKYVGNKLVSPEEWKKLKLMSKYENIRLNVKTKRMFIKIWDGYDEKTKKESFLYHQVPDLTICSSRSGADKGNLNLGKDVVKVHLESSSLFLAVSDLIKKKDDCRASFDTFAILSIALSVSFHCPKMIEERGLCLFHFHGYCSGKFRQKNEVYLGFDELSIPCGSPQAALVNLLAVQNASGLLKKLKSPNLFCVIEPDHGVNVCSSDVEYLISRLQQGLKSGSISLGGKFMEEMIKHKTI